MILRAAFWIAVVAVFAPHEPDLGFGRPSLPGFLPTKMTDWMSEKAPVQACQDRAKACSGGLEIATDLRSTILENLDRVKSELNEQTGLDDRRRTATESLAVHIPKL